MLTEADLLNCAGWKALNRIAPLGNIHNVFFQNWLELQSLFTEIYDDIQISKDIQNKAFMHLQQKIFNYLAASFALTDAARKFMQQYEGTTFSKAYETKVSQLFRNSNLAHFIRGLRNYQTHYELAFPYPVRSLEDGKHWDIVLISAELLEHKEEWNHASKQFIQDCGKEINLNKIFDQYTKLINAFYTWVYIKFKEYHKKDLEERDYLIRELKIQIPSSQLIQIPLSSEQCESIFAELQFAK